MSAAIDYPFLEGIDLLKDGVWVEAHPVIQDIIPAGELRDDKGKLVTHGDGSPIETPAVIYEKSEKVHILNKTNYNFMRLLFGTEDTGQWIGQRVTLYAAQGNWFGQQNQCALRVRLPADRPIPSRFRKQLGEDLTGKKINKTEQP